MSDVSGIPYMGPMGQGNFFAPSFSYNPQVNPTAGYAGPAAYGQGVLGGILQDTQRSQQYSANLISSAAMAMPNSPGGAYMFSDTGGPAGGWGGNAFNQGAINNFMTGGGGYNFPSIPDYSSGGGFGGASPYRTSPNVFNMGASGFSSPGAGAIDWGGLFGGGGGSRDPYPGMSMPGGLNSPMTMPQQQPLDYGSLFGRGVGGGGGTDPYPGMTMPGGLGSPMSASEPGASFGERFDALGGSAPMGGSPYTSGIAPDETGGRTLPQQQPLDYGSLFGQSVGGTSQAQPRAPDPAPIEGGSAGTSRMSDALLGYTPQQWPESAYDKPSDPLMDRPLPGNPYTDPEGGGLPAADLGAQARERLAKIMADTALEGAPTGRTAESAREAGGPVIPPADIPAGPEALAIPLPRRRPDEAPASEATVASVERPSDKVDMSLQGRISTIRETLKKELAAQDLTMTSDYRGPGHELYRPGSKHSDALAFDTRARTPAQADTAMAQIRELFTARGMVEGRDYKFIDEVRSPIGGITKGPHVHTTLTPEGMQRYQESAFDVNRDQVIPRPPADIPYPQGIPLPAERPGEAPARPEASTAPIEERPGVNQGQDITPPPAAIPPPDARVSGAGFNALDAAAKAPAPVKHSGLELARANIDTPIEKVAMERGGQKAVDQISSMVVGMTPRQIYESYGGMFMARAEPLFKSLGITRQDFEQAIKMSPTRQDLKMRFGEGTFGPYPAYTGPEAAPGDGGNWQLPMPSTLHPDITDERGQLANMIGPRSSAFGFDTGGFGEGGYGNAFTSAQTSGPGLDSPTWNAGRDSTIVGATETTNLTPGDLTQRGMGDPFNPENYNTLDQASDLSAKRAKGVAELRGNPDLMRTAEAIPIAEIGPDIANRSDADIAGFYETMLNNYASGARIADFPTLASILSPKGYYEPIRKNQQSMRDAYTAIDNDPALKARIDRIFDEVSRGSNVSNLSTQNSVQTGRFSEGGEGALQPKFGGVMGQYVPGPGEYFTSMLNPYNDPRAEDFIGASAQRKYRDFYRSLMPPGQMPWETR